MGTAEGGARSRALGAKRAGGSSRRSTFSIQLKLRGADAANHKMSRSEPQPHTTGWLRQHGHDDTPKRPLIAPQAHFLGVS